MSVRRRRSYFFSSFNPGGCRIHIYAKAIRPFRVIRVGGSRPGRAALFGEKFIYTFVLLQFEFIRLYGAALYAKKGSLAVCARRYKDVWMNMHVFSSRVW